MLLACIFFLFQVIISGSSNNGMYGFVLVKCNTRGFLLLVLILLGLFTLSVFTVTADGVTVGVCLFFSNILSKIVPAEGLNCWFIVTVLGELSKYFQLSVVICLYGSHLVMFNVCCFLLLTLLLVVLL